MDAFSVVIDQEEVFDKRRAFNYSMNPVTEFVNVILTLRAEVTDSERRELRKAA